MLASGIKNTGLNNLIKAGYTQDYNFKIFENESKKIRRDLKMYGVNKIIAFFDQSHSGFSSQGPILSDSKYDYGYINSRNIFNLFYPSQFTRRFSSNI